MFLICIDCDSIRENARVCTETDVEVTMSNQIHLYCSKRQYSLFKEIMSQRKFFVVDFYALYSTKHKKEKRKKKFFDTCAQEATFKINTHTHKSLFHSHILSPSRPLRLLPQNDQDLLRATAAIRGWNGYRNKSQHRKLTLEKKILPQGFEPATFQSRVRRSNR